MPPTICISQTVAGLGSTLVKVSVQATSEATVNVFPYEYGALKSDLLKEKSDGPLKNRAGVSGCGMRRRA